jgi:hypothetical protein
MHAATAAMHAAATAVHAAATAMHAATAAMHAAAAAMHAAATTASHMRDKAVVHMGCDAGRGEDLEGLSLRQTETEKRNAKERISGQSRPIHGCLPHHHGRTRSRFEISISA